MRKSESSSNHSNSLANLKSFFSKTASHSRFGFLEYRRSEYDELRKIVDIYKKNIVGLKLSESDSEEVPAILEADHQSKKPCAKIHEIEQCFFYDENSKGGLSELFRVVFQEIENFIAQRQKKWETKNYAYGDSAIVLFCAEMARWANDCGKRSPEEPLLSEIKGRIQYLARLEVLDLFQNEPILDCSFDLLAYNLRRILEHLVIPELQAQLSIESSREHFSELKKSTVAAFREATAALFYWFISDETIGGNFSLETFGTNITVNHQLEKAAMSPFGKLFKALGEVCKSDDNQLEAIGQPFFNGYGVVPSVLLDHLEIPDSQSKQVSIKNGIHPFFQSRELLEKLIYVLGNLCELHLFSKAFQQAYRLAGDGGDVLVYIGLCKEVQMILSNYFAFQEELLTAVDEVERVCDDQYTKLMRERNKSEWRNHYMLGHKHLARAKELLTHCNEQIRMMLTYMSKVQTKNYKRDVKGRIDQFQKTVKRINMRTESRRQLEKQSNSNSNNGWLQAQQLPPPKELFTLNIYEPESTTVHELNRREQWSRQGLFKVKETIRVDESDLEAVASELEMVSELEAAQEYEAAANLYLVLMKEHPDNLALKLRCVQCLIQLDNLEKKVLSHRLLQSILKEESSNVEALYFMGIVCEKLGELGQAKDYFSKVLDQNPQYEDIEMKFNLLMQRLSMTSDHPENNFN